MVGLSFPPFNFSPLPNLVNFPHKTIPPSFKKMNQYLIISHQMNKIICYLNIFQILAANNILFFKANNS